MVLVVKNPPVKAGRHKSRGFNPCGQKIPGGGPGNPLQDSCLENPTNREARSVMVHQVPELDTDTEAT